jgi:hypothetical protein
MAWTWLRKLAVNPTAKMALGERGEKFAARYLRRQGYKIPVRRFKGRGGEIDLVCRHKGWLVFVEVKTRKSEQYGSPCATELVRAFYRPARAISLPDGCRRIPFAAVLGERQQIKRRGPGVAACFLFSLRGCRVNVQRNARGIGTGRRTKVKFFSILNCLSIGTS